MAYKDIKPYSDLVHNASINGGVEKYIADIEKSNFLKGKSVGRLEGIGIGGIAVSVLVGGAILGKNLWDKYKLKVEEEKELEKNAENAKVILTENMNKENE